MEINLTKKPKNPVIIEGFPGFGLIGTISTEFLIDHLKTEIIGKVKFKDASPMVAIHESKVVQPMGIFYNKQHNIVIFHAITPTSGFEWDMADAIVKLAKELHAKEIISLEGVGSTTVEEASNVYYYSNKKETIERMKKLGVDPLKEGIIMGVTGSLILGVEEHPMTCIFAETHSNLPDSKAAAKVIEVLDRYLGLNVDFKPLLKQAEKFEGKIKDILLKSQQMGSEQKKKMLSYVG